MENYANDKGLCHGHSLCHCMMPLLTSVVERAKQRAPNNVE